MTRFSVMKTGNVIKNSSLKVPMPLFLPIDIYWLYLPKDVTLKYHSKFKAIGCLHIIIGVICVVIESGAIDFFIKREGYYPSIASGIWAGIIFLLAGVFSIASGVTGKYLYVIVGTVFSGLACLGSIVVIVSNSYFANSFIVKRTTPITVSIDDEDTKLIPPLLILIAAAFIEFIVSLAHFIIGCIVTELCFCCAVKRERKATDIRLNYPHRSVVTTISSAVTRADSFQYQGPYDTITTQVYPSYTRRAFRV